MRMTDFVASSALCLATVTAAAPALAADFYDHNGSLMELSVHADRVTIRYHDPKPSLSRLGVRPGTLLFEGYYSGRGLEGTAYVFRAGCQPAGYSVAGPAVADGIILSGAAPVRPKGSCRVTGYTRNSGNARLEFWQ